MKKISEIEMLLSAGKIVKILAHKSDKNKDIFCILFSDKKTIMQFEEQSPYTYHDCDNSARIIGVYQDADDWKRRMKSEYFVTAKYISS